MSNSSNLKTKVINRIEEVSVEDWHSVFPLSLENYHFFKSIDESNFDQFSSRYILVYDNDKLVGVASCFLMRFDCAMTVKGPLKAILGVIKKVLPNILSPKTLFCGLPMAVARIGVVDNNGSVMKAIFDCMENIAADEKAQMIIYKDFTNDYEPALRPLLKQGFMRVQSIPSTVMDINFSSFDDYLQTLSRSSRENLRRKFRQIDGKVRIDLEVTCALEEDVLSQVHELYMQTYKRQDLGLEKVPKEFFKQVAKNMPQEVKYFLWRIDGRLVAFAFCLASKDYFIDYYLGFDYSVAYEYHLYFVRFRDLMKWCIEQGIKKYEMGVTAYEPKRRLGFDFVPLYFYLKHRNPIINPIQRLIGNIIKPENFDPVFKEMQKVGRQ